MKHGKKKIGSENHINLAALYELIIFPLYFLKNQGPRGLNKAAQVCVCWNTHCLIDLLYTQIYIHKCVFNTFWIEVPISDWDWLI